MMLKEPIYKEHNPKHAKENVKIHAAKSKRIERRKMELQLETAIQRLEHYQPS